MMHVSSGSLAAPSWLAPSPASRQILAILVGSAALTAVAYRLCDVRFVHAQGLFLPFALMAALIGALSIYIKLRLSDNLHWIVMMTAAFVFLAAGTNLLLLQYCLATTKAVDFTEAIRAADHALGFDWLTFSRIMSSLPYVDEVIGFCYQQWITEFVVVVVLLSAVKQTGEVFRLIFAYIVSGTAMVLVSGVLDVKSVDAVSAYAISSIHHPTGVNPYYLQLLTSLRSSGAHVVDLNHLGGLVSFPSCHAGTAVLLATAMRNVKGLWLPFLCLNEFILIGTLTEGGHFLSDVIAGCLFAIAGVALHEVVSRPRRALAEPAVGQAVAQNT